jgi:hypothetical protein
MKNAKKVILGLASAAIFASSLVYATGCEDLACRLGLTNAPYCLCLTSK